jgi:GNAT superfamily N-acetyltransferase
MQLVRTSFMATHTDAQLDHVLEVFEKVGRRVGILSAATPVPRKTERSSPGSRTGPLEVTPAEGRADRTAFIRLPWRIYRGHPYWVPPLIMERREFLDPGKNPFFDFADVALFLARRGRDVLGRIAAIHDRNHNKFHGAQAGAFGLFECVNDDEVAGALLEAAAAWCRQAGLTTLWGPVSFSTNYECGLLVDGFDDRPAIMMPYNPPYYARLLTAAGFVKAHDLWAWEFDPARPLPARVARVAEETRTRSGLRVRHLQRGRLEEEIERIQTIYNEAWEANWGFVPMTRNELAKLTRDLGRIAVDQLALIAEAGDEPVAFALTLPDFNEVLACLNGRLLSPGVFKAIRRSRRIQRARLTALGVRAAYRGQGVEAMLYKDTHQNAAALGYTRGEIGWTLEDNEAVNRAIENFGGRRYKTYRLYQRTIGP